MRDITLEETVYFNFTTRSFSTGVPTTLLGTPVLSVLESNNATPITSGVTVAVDRASVTGLNQGTVVATAANGYEAGKSYALYISTGTVGGVSVVGEVVAQFTVQAAAAFTRLGAPAGASVSADVATITNKTQYLPSATAGAAGGVFIAGSNAATTFATLTVTGATTLTGNVALADGLTVAAPSTANRSGITVTGNGTGDGIRTTGGSGAGGDGMAVIAGGGSSLVADMVGNITGNITGNIIGYLSGSAGSIAGNVDGYIAGETIRDNYAQAGSGSTITLDASASAIDNFYANTLIYIWLGTGINQSRFITSYVGATKVATISRAWDTALDGTSRFLIKPSVDKTGYALTTAPPTAAENADALLGRNVAGGSSAGRLVKEALYVLRNKTDIAAGTLTVYGTDDTTSAFTAAVTTTAGNPISTIDPA